ncbi:MAG: nickel-dependent lactate racemase [Anaerolineae bacterium]|nr:nickel-dependent lactate racemase [Anaerolineae bacterium]
MAERYHVAYGRGEMYFSLPAGMRGTVVTSRELPPLEDPERAVMEALEHPIGSPRLRDMARPGQKVVIIFTDITRASPDHILLPPVLRELEEAGVRDEDITLLCGIGMHRPSTPEEKRIKLGADIVRRYRVMDHAPSDPAMLVDLGTTPSGIPLSVNKLAYEADLLIATGLVEPHQYAGYSGGSKTLAVGAGGEKMIEYTHGPHMLDHPGTRLGRIEGNPFQEAVMEAGRRAGLNFIINAVLDDANRIVAVRAGDPQAAFRELVRIARSIYEVPIDKQYDVVIGGVGFPKDANLYQASRAASYLYFAPTPVVRKGGIIIIAAQCPEGAGEGVGEQRFIKAMREAPDVQAVLKDAREHGYPPGQQRAFVMAKVLEDCPVIVVGSECPDIVRDAKMIPSATVEEALGMAAERLGRHLDVLIVPHAMHTLPIVRGGA